MAASGRADHGTEERRQSLLAAEVAARRQLPERLRAAQDRQQALQQKLDELDKLDDWQLQLRLDPQQWAELVAQAGDEP